MIIDTHVHTGIFEDVDRIVNMSQDCNAQFIPSSSRCYEVFDFDISDFESSEAIIRELKNKIHDGIYHITLTGNTKNGFNPNLSYIQSSLLENAFHIKISHSVSHSTDVTESMIFKLFSQHLQEICDDSLFDEAMAIGCKALEGVDLL